MKLHIIVNIDIYYITLYSCKSSCNGNHIKYIFCKYYKEKKNNDNDTYNILFRSQNRLHKPLDLSRLHSLHTVIHGPNSGGYLIHIATTSKGFSRIPFFSRIQFFFRFPFFLVVYNAIIFVVLMQ